MTWRGVSGGGAGGGRQNQGVNGNRSDVKLSIRDPERLEGKATYKTYKRWESSFNNWATLQKLDKKPRADQLATFRTHCSQDFQTRMKYAIGIPENTELTLDGVKEKIRNYLKNQTNVVVARKELLKRKQSPNEKFDDFLTDLLELAEDAEIDDMQPDDWRTTLIVCGINSNKTRKELLGKRPALDYNATVDKCRTDESGESRIITSDVIPICINHKY